MAEEHILKQHQDRLEARQEQRQEWLSQQDKPSRRALKGGLLGAVAVAGLHLASPGGIAGAGARAAKSIGAARGAASKAMKRVGGADAFTDPLQFRGLSPKKYIDDIGNFVTETAPQIKQRAGRVKSEFAKEYKKRKASSREVDIGLRAKELNQMTDDVAIRYRGDLAHKKSQAKLKRLAEQGGETEQEVVDKIRNKLTHRYDDMALKYDATKRTDELLNIGLPQDDAERVANLFDNVKQEVRDETLGMNFESFEDQLRQKVVEEQVRKRQGDQAMGIGPRIGNTGKGMLESLFGYKRATLKDLNSFDLPDTIEMTERSKRFVSEIKDRADHILREEDFVIDPDLLIHKDKGTMVDAGQIRNQLGALREQFSEGILGAITFQRDQILAKNFRRKAIHRLDTGYHQPGLVHTDVVDSATMRMQETAYGIGDKAYKAVRSGRDLSLEHIEGTAGREFTSGRFGATKRFMRMMSGVDAPDYGRKGAPAWESELLDISADSRPGGFTKFKSVFGKKKDPDWMQNVYKRAQGQASIAGNINRADARKMHRYVQEHASALPEDVIDRMSRDLDFKVDISSHEDMLDTYVNLFKRTRVDAAAEISDEALYSNARSMLERNRVVQNRGMFTSNRLQEGPEILQKEISDMLIDETGYNKSLSIIEEMFESGHLLRGQKDDVAEALASGVIDSTYRQSTMQNMGPMAQGLSFISETDGFMGDHKVSSTIKSMMDRTHPSGITGYGPLDYESVWRSDTLALKRFDLTPSNIMNTFTAGRGNMEDVHRGTMYAFNVPARLNQLIRDVDVLPLQLSDKSMSSPAGAFGNFAARRVLPFYAGKEAFKYIDDHSEDVTGWTLKQRYERAKAHTRFSTADIKESMGINSLMTQLDYATPGSEGLEHFLMNPPIQGPTAPLALGGRMANFAGITSTKSPEEWEEYYRYGQKPVRRGQHWLLGSQPWMGDGITHHKPNSYQEAMSQWKYTDTVYGDRETYWKHRPYPTPSAPLAPIRRFVTDRYWWEDMHEERRPYPVSGPLFDPDTAWGSLLNPTIGRFVKPMKEYTEGADRGEVDDYVPPSFPIGRYTRGDLQVQSITPEFMMTQENTATMQIANQTAGWTGQANAEQYMEGNYLTGRMTAGAGGRYGGYTTGYQIDYNVRVDNVEGEAVLFDETTGKVITPEEIAGNTINPEAVNIDQAGRTLPNNQVPADIAQMEDDSVEVPYGHGNIDDIKSVAQAISGGTYNQSIQQTSQNINDLGVVTEPGGPIEPQTPEDVRHPGSLDYQIDRIQYIWGLRMPGIRGYLANIAFFGGDDFGEGDAVLADASLGWGETSRFYRSGVGGRGGPYSEVLRRFFQRRPGLTDHVNTLPNTMPNWMPSVMRQGDQYAQMPGGEYRLPGEAYESLNTLHPDRHGKYGAVDRASILADVAPWSDEYRYWLGVAQNQDLTDEAKEKLNRALERSRAQQSSYHFADYQYKYNNIERDTFTIDQFIDGDRFTVKESDRVFRFAGIHGSLNTETEQGQKMVQVISENMMPGTEVTLQYENRRNPEDTSPAVVYARGQNINNMLKEYGVTPHEEQGDIEPYMNAHPYARGLGSIWENIARTRVPILHRKVFNMYSPIEHYKEFNLYGTHFQNWQEPYDKVIKPVFQAYAARNPLQAVIGGAGAGMILGGMLFGGSGAKLGAYAGATIGGGLSLWRQAHELKTGEAWIPENEQQKRDIEEYYDRLEYLKNKRLHNKYRDKAIEEEDVDIDAVIAEMDELEEEVDEIKRNVDAVSEQVREDAMYEGKAYMKTINAEGNIEFRPVTDRTVLQEIRNMAGMDEVREAERRDLITNLGPYARKAVEYRQQKRSTMYGLDSDATVTEIMRALPSSERDYFTEFLDIEDEERRQEVLGLVPDDTARALRMMWGMPYGDPKDIGSYFESNYLPDDDWLGWHKDVDIEDSQIKTIENVGKDPKDFGIWQDYTKMEELTPTPYSPWEGEGFDSPNPRVSSVKRQLELILDEYNIDDAKIDVKPTKKRGIDINVDIMEDLTGKTEERIEQMLA